MVATTNANESRMGNSKADLIDKVGDKKGYGRPGQYHKPNNSKDFSQRPKNMENRPKYNGYNDKGFKDNGYKDEGYKDKGYKDKGIKSTGSSYFYVDKDEEDERRHMKGRKPTDQKSKTSQMKDIDQPSDKLETIKRLEREKKVIQRKNREEEVEKPRRNLTKQKRSVKDWTKGYVYGLLDEEEDYSLY